MSLPLRLEVHTGQTWVDLLGSTNQIQVSRSPLNLGTLTATILDTALDPSRASTLASGRPLRLHTSTAAGWRPLFTGKIDAAKVTYPRPEPGADPDKAARIEVSAVDPMQAISAATEARSVHTANNLRTLLAAAGIQWLVNGTAAAGPTSPLVVARNDQATLADQVAITRDTLGAYAWVDASGILRFNEPSAMPTGLAATYTDQADGHPSYSALDAAYDSADVVDEVAVTFLVYKTAVEAVEEVTHTVRRPGATGTNQRTYTLVGPSMSAAQIKTYCEQFAQRLLDRNATAVVRPLGLTTPVRTAAERATAVAAEPCALVRVAAEDRLDTAVRVDTVEHQITAVTGTPDPVQWVATYTYTTPEAMPEAQRIATFRAAPVQDRLAAAEANAAQGVKDAASAQIMAEEATSNLVGAVFPFAGSVAPTGFLMCNGASINRAAYNHLFAIIGTTYGSVDANTFNLPDLRGRFPIGAGTFAARGDSEGVAEASRSPRHRHTVPSHTHPLRTSGGHSHGGSTGQGPSQRAGATTSGANNEGFASHTHSISFDGAHDHGGDTLSSGALWSGYAGDDGSNAVPFLGLNFIIRAEYPRRPPAAS